nr:DUF2314 domain-containing protein [uncultured Allomuricauda sp.]
MNKTSKSITSVLMIGIIAVIGFFLIKNFVSKENDETKNTQTEWDKNNMREIEPEDKLLVEIKQETKLHLSYFISEFKKSSKSDFFAKVKLTENEKTEHIWVEILKLDNDKSIGLLGNEPKYFKNMKYLDTLTFDINQSEDLMIMENDSIVFGGFLQAALKK